MPRRPALALIALVALLAPSFPFAAAADPIGSETGFEWLPLYVTSGREADANGGDARGFSSLLGDAMPTDPASRTWSQLDAITRETSSIRVAKEDAFRVQLVSPDDYEHVRGSISVFAVDALDQRTPIARATFAPPVVTTAGTAQQLVNSSLNQTLAPLHPFYGPIAEAVVGHAVGQYDEIRDLSDGPILSSASEWAYQELCRNWENPQCRSVTGRYGMPGAFDVCRAQPPGTVFGDALWTAAHTVDEAHADVTGERLCGNALYDDVNTSAGSADGAVGGVDLPPLPIGGSLLAPPPAEDGPAPHAWKDVTLDATVPSWFPQDDAGFVVPAGVRLALEVRLSGVVRAGDTHTHKPIQLEYGRADAPTALLIRHASPGAFAAFAYDAEPIVLGVHTGFFANHTDADDYSFVGGEGTLRLTTLGGGSLHFTVYDEDGRATSGGGPVFTVPAPSFVTLRVQGTTLPFYDSDYAFRVELIPEEGEPDDGLIVGPGSYTGALGASDHVDQYTVFAWTEQRVNMTLAFSPEVAFRVRAVNGGFHDVTEADASGLSTFSGRAGSTGYFTFAVERSYGQGSYVLGVELDAAGNLTRLPELVPTWEPGEGRTFGAFIGDADAVVVAVDDRSPEPDRIERISLDERSVLISGATQPLAFAAGGELMHIGWSSGASRVTHHADGVQTPVSRWSSSFAFLPDGSFVSTRTGLAADPLRTFVVHTDAAGVETLIDAPDGRLVTAPDGSLYLVPDAASAFLVDIDARVVTPAPEALHGVLGFDMDGRAYRLLRGSLIERVDVATGEREIVAWTRGTIGSVAVSETRLFASLGDSLAAVPMPGGFGGFRPAFAPRALPDITVERVEEVEVRLVVDAPPAEERVFRVHLSNIGGGDALPHPVLVGADCHCVGDAGWTLEAPAIPAGGSASVEFIWRSVGSGGEYAITVMADRPFPPVAEQVVESDERNNFLRHATSPVTGDARALCRAQLEGTPLPVDTPFTRAILRALIGSEDPRDACELARL